MGAAQHARDTSSTLKSHNPAAHDQWLGVKYTVLHGLSKFAFGAGLTAAVGRVLRVTTQQVLVVEGEGSPECVPLRAATCPGCRESRTQSHCTMQCKRTCPLLQAAPGLTPFSHPCH
ncbi:unnamed protein product [Caretta caretta]